tara:strand:- start:656 stop:3118 length:2463 start_codon:yes stop_codon:yes gene_type:complete
MNKVLIPLITLQLVLANSASLIGKVIDQDTHQPLSGTIITIEELENNTITDENGNFRIDNIPSNNYTITASMIGYAKLSKVNVSLTSNRQSPIKFMLVPQSLEGQEIQVSAGYFEKAKDAIISTQTIDRDEIRSDPVGVYDIQMMVHSLPSVITATDQNNEIIVRGGGPSENLFQIDNLEIPNPNHFGEVGTGGGPVNIINTEFVERIDFFAGGFPAKFGDKQSSVMDIQLRDGSNDKLEIDLELSMAGVGFLIEGPLFHEKVSFISSYRKSFIKDLIKSAGLTSVPEYSNTQHKITYNFSDRTKLIFNFVGAIDSIDIKDENRPDLRGAENVKYNGNQYTVGMTLKSLLNKKGYHLFSLGKTLTNWKADVYKMEESFIDTFFYRQNMESDNFLKWDLVYKANKKLEFSTGLNIKYGQYQMNEKLDADTLFSYNYTDLNLQQQADLINYDNYYDLIESNPSYLDLINNFTINPYTSNTPINEVFENDNQGGLWKYAQYSQIKISLNRMILTTGIRYDNVPYNKTSKISPRLGFNYLINTKTKLNVAFGNYYQTPNYWIFLNPKNENKLKHSHSKQMIIGIEYLISNDTKATLELYSKKIFNRSVMISEITSNPFDQGLGFTDIGKGTARGAELFIQKKFSSKWYGTLSYSYGESIADDYRDDKSGKYPWNYDVRNSFTLVGGYKVSLENSLWYNKIRKSKLFSWMSWIPVMPSDRFEISFRYRYAGGMPYTPQKYNFHYRIWYIDNEEKLNSHRSDYYSRLDIMLLRRFSFKNINLTTFLDLQNIFNRDNQWQRVYFDDGTYKMSYQYKQMPVGGIIIEF